MCWIDYGGVWGLAWLVTLQNFIFFKLVEILGLLFSLQDGTETV